MYYSFCWGSIYASAPAVIVQMIVKEHLQYLIWPMIIDVNVNMIYTP